MREIVATLSQLRQAFSLTDNLMQNTPFSNAPFFESLTLETLKSGTSPCFPHSEGTPESLSLRAFQALAVEPLDKTTFSKKPLTRVSKRVPGVHGKRGLERGWQKRLAEKVGKRLAKGWRRVGEGLAKGWRRVGEGLAKGWRVSV